MIVFICSICVHSLDPKYINSQKNALQHLPCILFTKSSPKCFGRHSGDSQGDALQPVYHTVNTLPTRWINPLNPELNPICYLLALLGAHQFLHVSRIRVKLLTLRRLMSYIYIYIYGAPILDVSRSHTTTQHSR